MADNAKICPKCAESVRAEAKVCRHCGHTFGSQEEYVEVPTPKKGGMLKKGLGCLGIAVLLLILIAFFAGKDASETSNAKDNATAASTNADGTQSAPGNSAQEPTEANSAPSSPEPGLTQANFDRIRDGMTVDQVSDILGAQGEKISESSAGGSTMTAYQWKGGMLSGRIVMGTFDDGKLMSKTQVGL